MKPPAIVPLRAADLDQTATAMSEAFQDDPLQKYMLPDPAMRVALSPGLFALILRYGLQFGEVLTNAGPPAGAAIWLKPTEWEVTPERAAAAGLDQLPQAIGAEAAERFLSVLGTLEPYHHKDVPPAHWYLFVLGVAPPAQGRGLGRALMQPVLDRADAAGLPCYLETASAKNVPFYEHLGFQCVVETVEAKSGLRLWTFRRDPPRKPAAI